MTSRLTGVSVDCHDPERLAASWCAVLGFEVVDREPGLVEVASRAQQAPPTMVFVQVPEGKATQDRLHLDVSPVDRTQDEEVQRLLELRHWAAPPGRSRSTPARRTRSGGRGT